MSASPISLAAEEQVLLINQLQEACAKLHIKTSRVLAITIQQNRTSHFTSLVVDFPAQVILTHYPNPDALQGYRELQVGQFLVALKEDLPCYEIVPAEVPVVEEQVVNPFCCDKLQPYKPRRIALEQTFTDFVNARGDYPQVVYEVKKQRDNGALISTTYWQLKQNERKAIQGDFNQKMHAFKNYRCPNHGLFFGLDLYKLDNEAGYNYHHMRLNPFTKVVPDVFAEFVRNVGASGF